MAKALQQETVYTHPEKRLHIIAADDDEANLEIMVTHLTRAGYTVEAFQRGDDTYDAICKAPDKVDIVLLDKMMPGMDGVEMLSKIKKNPALRHLPVILQTAAVGVNEAKEAFMLGAHYYLTKPYDMSMLVSLVDAVARDYVMRVQVWSVISQEKVLISTMEAARFQYRDLQEAQKLAAALASTAKEPEKAGLVLLELLVNAVEHGALGQGYDRKRQLLSESQWDKELDRLLRLPENQQKYISVRYQKGNRFAKVTIADPGEGFNWMDYMDFDPMRLQDPNGRGVATANMMGFDLRYNAKGNEASCVFPINL